jgi:uncharacterized Zn-finger protein
MNRMKNNILENDAISGINQETNKKFYTKFVEIPQKIEKKDEEHKCFFQKCMRTFLTSNHLKDHLKSHMTFKTFHCQFDNCGKIYKSKENLVLHIKNIHLKLKPYRCRFCDSSFSHRNGKILNFYLFYLN